MDPISKLAQSLALIRRQAGAKPAAPARAGTRASAQAQAPRAGATAAPGDLRARIVAAVGALNEAELTAGERPAAVFVEQVLLHEWGPAFRESPQFRQTVRRVARAMRGEPQVRGELEAMLRELATQGRNTKP